MADGEGGSGGEQGAGQSGEAGGAEYVLGEAGAGGETNAAEDLGGDQDAQDPGWAWAGSGMEPP